MVTQQEIFHEPGSKWTWLTWLQLALVLLLGSILSVLLRNYNNSLLLYLPSAIAVIYIQWFGPRVLVLSYLNGILTLFLWNAPGDWLRYLILASHEPLVCFLSWLLARKFVDAENGFSTTRRFVQFTLLGIAVPGLANCFYTYHYSFVHGDLSKVLLLWLADFITIYSIAIPSLHFLTPSLLGHGLISIKPDERELSPVRRNFRNLLLICLFFLGLNFLIDFSEYWFVYGICAVIVAVRRGFEAVLLTNLILFSLSYLFPMVFLTNNFTIPQPLLLSVHLGMITMFFVSSLIGRAISDFHEKEGELTLQKKQLENANELLNKTNSELDRFVYSVSHDISAPLKSIKGLVTLSRLDKDPSVTELYLGKIEASVQKLEGFVGEVLDHSRTVRKEILVEPVPIESLVNDINDNLKYLDNFNRINFIFDFTIPIISTDKFLIKVALSNLLSNAIKYQKRYRDHQAEITVSTTLTNNQILIRIADNGEGIADAYKERIFEMFYRGTSNSSGSGLGLYIAKEAVQKLQGSITVETTYGKGSIFTLQLPNR
jgi:signal transduction histidine kinase